MPCMYLAHHAHEPESVMIIIIIIIIIIILIIIVVVTTLLLRATSLLVAEPILDFIERARQNSVWQPQMAKISQHSWCTVDKAPHVLHQILTELNCGHGVDAHFVQRAKDAFPNQWVCVLAWIAANCL